MTILDMRGVRRAYDEGREVLCGVDLSVEPGEVVGLLGRNGAGKTTLLRIAMGLIRAQAGSVRLFGLEHESDSVAIKRRIGYVSEDQILPPFLRVRDVLDLHRTLFPSWDRDLEKRLCERFEMSMKKHVRKLSKGQARQVAVVCAVAHRPELLLLDEPAGGLDPAARREFLEVAIDALTEAGSTIVFSSHHMQDVERIAGRVVLVHDGRVLIDRDLDALREELSLAIVTPVNGSTLSALRRQAGCLAAREHAGEARAVFQRRPDDVRAQLEADLVGARATCAPLGLEDLFIEAVEGQAR